jgi:hypothetical protein
VKEEDADGNVVQCECRHFANAAMTARRREWIVGQRAQEKIVPASSPFSRMGLKARSPGRPVKETPIANWEQLVAFRAAARKFGYGSVATAALVTWEWLQREEHVFGAFEIAHYRPRRIHVLCEPFHTLNLLGRVSSRGASPIAEDLP